MHLYAPRTVQVQELLKVNCAAQETSTATQNIQHIRHLATQMLIMGFVWNWGVQKSHGSIIIFPIDVAINEAIPHFRPFKTHLVADSYQVSQLGEPTATTQGMAHA